MTDETAETEAATPTDVTSTTQTAGSDSHDDPAVEGEIVNGTWVNPNYPSSTVRRTTQVSQVDYTMPDGRPSLMRMVYGSVVMVSDELSERATIQGDDAPEQVMQAAINQAVQQQQALDRRSYANLRYGTIGFVGSALDRVHSGSGQVAGITQAAAATAGKIISPVWNSFLFAPLHKPVMRAEQAGETKVEQWIHRGRSEEVRSRALAEVSLNNLVEESVSDLTQNTEVQTVVSQLIASQSTSIVGELLDEIRERFVSLDIILMGKLHRQQAAAPEFRDSYLDSMAERRIRFHRRELQESLAGTYGGPVTRLMAFLLDIAVLIIITTLLSAFVSNAIQLFGQGDRIQAFLASEGMFVTAALMLVAFFNIIIISVYFIFSWNLLGATVGDAVFGITVVNKKGGRVTIIRAFLRLTGMYISALALFLGFIWALFDRRRQGWHDKLGGTFVLYDWPAKPEEQFMHDRVMAQLERNSGS